MGSLARTSLWLVNVSHLLLLEVADGLNGQFAFDWRGGVARFQLDDGLGSFVQARHHCLEFIQLFSLILFLIHIVCQCHRSVSGSERLTDRDSPQRPAAGPPAAWQWWSGRSCISFSCSPAFSSSCLERPSRRQRTAQEGN